MEEEPVYEHDDGMEEDEQPKENSKEEVKIDEDALKLAEARQNHASGRLGEAQSIVDSLTDLLKDLEDKVAAAAYFRRHFSRIHESKQKELDKVINDVKKANEDIQHFSKQITVANEDANAIKQGLPPPSIVEVNERLKKRDRAGDYIQYDEDNDYIGNRRSRSPRSARDDIRRRGTTGPASTHDLHPMIESLFLNALDSCLEKQTMPFSIGEINLEMKELQPKWDMQKDTGLTRFYEMVKLFERAGHLVSLKEARQVMIIDSRRIHGGKGGKGGNGGGSRKRRSSREDDRNGDGGGGGEDRSRRRVERGGERGGERERRGGGDREKRGRREGGRNDDVRGNVRKNDPPIGVVGREKGEQQQQQQGRFPGRDDDEDEDRRRRRHESGDDIGGEGRFPESRWEPEDSVE